MMFKDKYINRFYAFALAAVFAIALAGCGGGGTAAVEEPPPMPTPEETCTAAGNQYVGGECLTPAQVTINAALAKIAAATTAEAAQAAYDEVKDDVTATEGERLQAAVDARVMAIEMAAREADQKMALAEAAGMIDTSDLSTQEMVDAARMAIAGLRQALADADDVSDADKAMYMTQLTAAATAVDEAQGGIDTDTRRTNQMAALSEASMMLQAALAALSGSTPTQAQLDAANTALTALNMAITGGGDLTDDEKAPYQREANNAAAPIQMAQTAKDDADNEAAMQQAADMAANAAKLYAGIDPYRQAADANETRRVRHNADNRRPEIEIGGGVNLDEMVGVFEEDDATPVAALHGWQGTRYAMTDDDGGKWELVQYAFIGDPTQGKKFGGDGDPTGTDDWVYNLNAADGTAHTVDTTAVAAQMRVASASFDQGAGVKTFKKADGDPFVPLPGSYHGVSGMWRCTPAADTTCASQISNAGIQLGTTAADGTFTVSATAWIFKPADPDTRVMDTPDADHEVFGYWLHAPERGRWFASAFHNLVDGRDPTAAEPTTAVSDNLNGTATYTGGAAGKYAIAPATEGQRDAGHFTADATLTAKFSNDGGGATHEITGVIDNFKVGDDGAARDWSVKLNEGATTAAGVITGPADSTVWSIGGEAAEKSGEWGGAFRGDLDGGVPEIMTGAFYSEHGNSAKMVGAFGVNK